MRNERNPFDFKIDREEYNERQEAFIDGLANLGKFAETDLRAKRSLFQHLISTARAINYLQNLSDETLEKAERLCRAGYLTNWAYISEEERKISDRALRQLEASKKERIKSGEIPELFSYGLFSFCKRSLRELIAYYSGVIVSKANIFFDKNLERRPLFYDTDGLMDGSYASSLRRIAKYAWELENPA